jgi:hypothetical protein
MPEFRSQWCGIERSLSIDQLRSTELFPRIQHCCPLLSVSGDFGQSPLDEIIRLTVGVLWGEVSEGKCSSEDSTGWYMDLEIRRCLKSKIIHVPRTEATVAKGKVC